jgi:hypothetical protein
MDEIISYTMCAVKVRNAKLRNYLKRFQQHILFPVVYFFSLLHSLFEHKRGKSWFLIMPVVPPFCLFMYVAGRGGQQFFTCCPAGNIAFISSHVTTNQPITFGVHPSFITRRYELIVDRNATTWKIQGEIRRFEQRPFVGKLAAIKGPWYPKRFPSYTVFTPLSTFIYVPRENWPKHKCCIF